MNAERLLKVYEQISEAPDAIARLRRFVLDLAVRGKLVEQDASDEPASELLARIAEHRKRLIKAGEIKKPKPLDDFEVPSSAPIGWQWERLGALLLLMKNGLNTKATKATAAFKITRIETISFETIDLSRVGYLDSVDDATIEKHRVLLGDILFSHINSEAHLGKTAICERDDPSLLHGVNLLLLRAMPEISPSYLNLALRQLRASGFFISISQRAVNQSSINQKNLSQTFVAVPPLAEQHRIVAKVDELMALCDRLEEARKTREEVRDKLTAASLARLTAPETTSDDFPTHAAFALEALPALTTRPDQIKTLRQTILNLAVRGKLVEQDPADEPVSELLNRIGTKRAELVKAGEAKKLKPRKDEAWPFTIPGSWSWCALGEVSSLVTKGSSPKWQGVGYVEKDTGLLFITSENVGNFTLRKLNELKYVEARFKEIEPRSMLRRGDILINLVGASIGRSAIYDLDEEANINQAVALVRMTDPEDCPSLDYLLKYLNSDLAVDLMLGSRVTTAQPNISLTDAAGFPVPLPPLAEQHRIVAKVDALMALCDRLEAALTTTDTTRTRLLEALLHEALEPAAETVSEAAE